MPGIIALVYLLLSMRLRLHVHAGMWGMRGCVKAELSAPLFVLRIDGELGNNRAFSDRYGALKGKQRTVGETIRALKKAKPYLTAFFQAGKWEQIGLNARLGMGDAAASAISAGALRAIASALTAGKQEISQISIQTQQQQICLLLEADCIFSASAGDIIFAAVKAALRTSRREGFRWKSIPLRA